MNIGNIPGFYYDAEKKKYFKIQADRDAPKDAKYSKGNVQHDKRESKKRKLEERRRKHVRKQTAGRSNALSSPLMADIGLHREQGGRSTTRSLASRDTAIVRQLEPIKKNLSPASLHYDTQVSKLAMCSRSKEAVFSLRNSEARSGATRSYTLHSMPSSSLDGASVNPEAFNMDNTGGPYAAFGQPVTSISTAPLADDSILLFACTEQRASPGNVFSGRLTRSASSNPLRSQHSLASCNFATLGTTPTTTLWASSINPAKDTIAVAGTLGVWSLDLACTLKDRLSISRPDYAEPEDDYTHAVDWLDAHTIAAGSETVYLWDQRSGGASQRFSCKAKVTGIQNPERGILRPEDNVAGQTLLVSTNRAISLFDVRYVSKSRPLLSWWHEHEGPQIAMSSNGQGLFAAVDRDYYTHVYSTRTGGEVARLRRAEQTASRAPVTNLMWFEDSGGRVGLRALQWDCLLEWMW